MSNTGHFLQDTLKYLHVASEAKRSKEIERYTEMVRRLAETSTAPLNAKTMALCPKCGRDMAIDRTTIMPVDRLVQRQEQTWSNAMLIIGFFRLFRGARTAHNGLVAPVSWCERTSRMGIVEPSKPEPFNWLTNTHLLASVHLKSRTTIKPDKSSGFLLSASQ